MNELRAVVVGYGWWGRACHCYLIGLTPGICLHGIVSSQPEKRKEIRESMGCKAYEDLDDAIADPEVDLVILATPSNTHAGLATRALRGGKHVITEKVMARTLAECDEMIAAAKESGKLLTVFQNRRRDGDFLTLNQLIADGQLGDVRWVEMAWQGFGPWGGWRGHTVLGGGRFYDLGAHLVDQLLFLFPEPIDSVYCRMHHDLGTEVESDATIVVGFEGGRTGICDVSSMAAISKPRFYVRGTEATWIKYGLDPQEAAMLGGDIDSAEENPDNYGRLKPGKEEERIVSTHPGRWRDYYENIVAVLTEGAEPIVKLHEARRVMSVIDAAMRSAQTGNAIRGTDILTSGS